MAISVSKLTSMKNLFDPDRILRIGLIPLPLVCESSALATEPLSHCPLYYYPYALFYEEKTQGKYTKCPLQYSFIKLHVF